MTRLHHDFETFSRADLPKVGTSRYARDVSTEALMCAYAFDDDPVRQWVPAEGEPMPPELRDAMTDPHVRKIAWNKPFEWNIWKFTLGIDTPHDVWSDPMVIAMTLSLPGKLEHAAKVMGLPQDKQKDSRGKALIQKFSKPRKPTKNKPWTRNRPEHDYLDWLDYCTYNRQDVEVERAIWRKIWQSDLDGAEREMWVLDQEINSAGYPINMEFVRNAISIRDVIAARKLEEMREITGLSNPNSPQQLLPWLREHGYPFDDLKKGHVERALARGKKEVDEGLIGDNFAAIHDEYLTVLELRQETSKTSLSKFDALERATDEDGFLRFTFQFAGAQRTARWAGRIFQPQNVAKPTKQYENQVPMIARHAQVMDAASFELVYEKPMDALSSAIRPAVQAGPGMMFADVDLSAIENIVLGWISGERKILSVFENDRDPYLDFAQYLFGMPYDVLVEEFKAGLKGKRTLSKPGVLGCGYMLSAGAEFENETTGEIEATGLLGYAWNMGVKDFTLEDSKHSVATWRGEFTEAVAYWSTIERAARKCIVTGNRTQAGPVEFVLKPPFLQMILPSGRKLSYLRPKVKPTLMPWGKTKDAISYEGQNDRKQWARISTHPGKLTENADQAIARDILRDGMLRAKREGLDIRLHVHDQCIVLAPENKVEEHLRILKECLTEPPAWASDIPLNCGGFATPIFTKD